MSQKNWMLLLLGHLVFSQGQKVKNELNGNFLGDTLLSLLNQEKIMSKIRFPICVYSSKKGDTFYNTYQI